MSDATSDGRTLGGRLQDARERQGLSLKEAAMLSGVQVKTLKNWELDRSEPRSNRLVNLAGVMGVNISYLLNGQGGGATLPHKSKAEVRALLVALEDRSSGLIKDVTRISDEIQAINQQLMILRQADW